MNHNLSETRWIRTVVIKRLFSNTKKMWHNPWNCLRSFFLSLKKIKQSSHNNNCHWKWQPKATTKNYNCFVNFEVKLGIEKAKWNETLFTLSGFLSEKNTKDSLIMIYGFWCCISGYIYFQIDLLHCYLRGSGPLFIFYGK